MPSNMRAGEYTEARQYDDIHHWLRLTLGSAKGYDCVGCGGQAEHWSLDKNPKHGMRIKRRIQRVNGNHTHTTAMISNWVGDYSPRCRPCHRVLDFVPRPKNPIDHPAFADLRRALDNA